MAGWERLLGTAGSGDEAVWWGTLRVGAGEVLVRMTSGAASFSAQVVGGAGGGPGERARGVSPCSPRRSLRSGSGQSSSRAA